MIISSTNSVENKNSKFIVYAPSGHGKTWQVQTLDKPIILSYESGLDSVGDKDIAFVDMTKSDKGELLSVEARIKKIGEVFKELQKEEYKVKFKTIFIDSLTEIAELIYQSAKLDAEKIASETGKNPDGFKIWDTYISEIKKLVKAFRDIPHYDVVFVCLDHEYENTDTGEREFTLALPGNRAKKEIPGLIDNVFYLEKRVDKDGKEARRILTNRTAKIFAKNRVPATIKLELYEEANLGKLIKKLRGEK